MKIEIFSFSIFLKYYVGLLAVCFFVFSCQPKYNANRINVDELRELAMDNYRKKDYPSAIIYFDRLIMTDTSNIGEYYYKRGVSKENVRDFNGAKEDLLLAVKRKYNLKYAYKTLSDITIKQSRDTTLALHYINLAYQEDPTDEMIIMSKLVLMGQEEAMKFTLDSLL